MTLKDTDTKFAEAVLRGEVELLGVEEIVARLKISRNTLERWIRNGRSIADVIKGNKYRTIHDHVEDINEGHIRFPPPDIYIGKSPKWDLRTVAQWLTKNSST